MAVGKAYFDFLGQVTYNTADGADWSKGAIMFDFPSFRPTVGDHKRFNEQFCRWLDIQHKGAVVLTFVSKITKSPTRSLTSSRAARTGPRTRARSLPGLPRTWIPM